MGVFKKLFGGADRTREAMRESYVKHVRLAETRLDEADDD